MRKLLLFFVVVVLVALGAVPCDGNSAVVPERHLSVVTFTVTSSRTVDGTTLASHRVRVNRMMDR